MNYEFAAKYLKIYAGGDNNCETTWPGLMYKMQLVIAKWNRNKKRCLLRGDLNKEAVATERYLL